MPDCDPQTAAAPGAVAAAVADLLPGHAGWASRFAGDDPVYALPDEAIDSLARPAGVRVGPILDAAAAGAEAVFAGRCRALHAVGFWAARPVVYPLLVNAGTTPPDAGRNRVRVARLAAEADAAGERRLGAAGWLMTDPAYLEEVARVRRAYESLPAAVRPLFPLARRVRLPDTPGAEARFHGFGDALLALLDRWGLSRLVTWDLPEPQGPLLPDLQASAAAGRVAPGVWVYVPVHYPLQGDDDLQRRVAEFQRQRAADAGVDPDFAGNPRHAAYRQMFRVMHVEAAVRRRFPARIRGLTGHLHAATAAALGLSDERVRRLRRWVARCRAGDRSHVSDFRRT